MGPSLGILVLTFACTLVTVRLVERYATALRLVDLPNSRSSHVEPRPRGGGLGIFLGTIAGAAVATISGAPLSRTSWWLIGTAVPVTMVGLCDDVYRLPVQPRLLVQTSVAVVIMLAFGGLERLPLPPPLNVPLGPAGTLLSIVWIIGVTNFFNFMDGADGLAAGQAIVTFVVISWALWPGAGSSLALLLAVATAGFLVRNWSPAHIFLGDVGSFFLGFLLAALPFTASMEQRPRVLLLVATSLALFLLDPVTTLLVRSRRGANLAASHRDHAYQQLFDPAQSHAYAVTWLLGASIVLSLIGAAAYSQRASRAGWLAIGASVVAFAAEWRLAARRRSRREQ